MVSKVSLRNSVLCQTWVTNSILRLQNKQLLSAWFYYGLFQELICTLESSDKCRLTWLIPTESIPSLQNVCMRLYTCMYSRQSGINTWYSGPLKWAGNWIEQPHFIWHNGLHGATRSLTPTPTHPNISW